MPSAFQRSGSEEDDLIPAIGRALKRHSSSDHNKEQPMYDQAISQLIENIKAIEVWLDKAEAFAATKRFDVEVLLNGRLAPDMKPLIYQVQSASDYVKGGAAWLSGQKPPRYEDNERTIDELRTRIRKTIAFVESVKAETYEGAGTRKVSMSFGPAGKVLVGKDYLLQMVVPNAYFHVCMAYAILRHHGVDVGKMDFLGSINWIDAKK
jgi:hypothetical protein